MAETKSVSEIVNLLSGILQSSKARPLPIPPPLILTGSLTRTGLSAREIAKEIILRQQEAGAPIGALPDGSDNITEKMELIRVETILRHLLENAKFTVVLPAGIPVTVSGANAGGAVICQGATSGIGVGTAIIQ